MNRPGVDIAKMLGGVLGGSVMRGMFRIDDEIEIRPGYEREEANKKVWKPLRTKVNGLMTGTVKVGEVTPGGSVALLTMLDPSIVKSDTLVGAVVSLPGKGYPIWSALTIETHLLKRVVGTKQDLDVEPIKKGEILLLNVNAAATVGVVQELGRNQFKCSLKRPVCAELGSRVTISRMIGSRFRLIGYGILKG